ncbi:M43 family zinc metalloprotease (plasmid) [Leptospira sp. WS39.C2]
MRKNQIPIFITILIFSTFCVKKKAVSGVPDNILSLLIATSINNLNSGPCVTIEPRQLTSIGNWMPNGNVYGYSEIVPISLNIKRPMLQVFSEYTDFSFGGIFPIWYLDRNQLNSGFLNKDVATYIGYNTHTSMLPYAKDTSYATDPAVSIMNTGEISQPLGFDFNFENSPYLNTTLISSCRGLENDEVNFQTSDAISSQSGLNHFWSSEKTLNVNIIVVNRSIDPLYPIENEQALNVALNKWKENFAQPSVRINLNITVSSHEMPEYDMIFDLSTENAFPGSLGGLFQTTSYIGKPNALNVFLVKGELQYGGVLGVSGGIPGPATLLGTRQSGIVIFVDSHRLYTNSNEELAFEEQQLLGETLSHEAGHFLGLWHVTEATGDNGMISDKDPLRDTPTCHISNDLNLNGYLELFECLGGGGTNSGGTNMMFWSGSVGFTQGDITAEQGWILRLNPLVY